MTDQLPALCDRAAAGAAFLDKNEPGWAKRVRLNVLDLERADFCVLGQLYGDYYDAVDDDTECVHLAGKVKPKKSVYSLGFNCDDEKSSRKLTACWKDEIRARRKATKS